MCKGRRALRGAFGGMQIAIDFFESPLF